MSIRKITINEGITTIGNSTFAYCRNLTSVTLPDSLTTIKEDAFRYCNGLTSIRIPSGVTSIGNGALSCDKIYIDDLSSWLNCSVGGGPRCNLYLNNTLLTDIVVPDDVTQIGNGVFRNSSSLKSITISNSVTRIGAFSFSNCSNLTTVTVPDSVTAIGEYAFNECGSLMRISIPNGVTEIKRYTFYNCRSLTSATIPASVTTINERAFCNCDILKQVDLPLGITSIGEYAFYRCGLTSLVFPPNVTSVGTKAFADNEITNIQISEGTTNICKNAFSYCDALKSITIPANVNSMGNGVFTGCSSLERIQISDLSSWLNIDFAGKRGSSYDLYLDNQLLTNIVIPEGTTGIRNYAFSECTSLTSITIPNSVTDIGSYAFSDCSNLISITIPDSVTDIGSYAFSGCSGMNRITIPDSVISIGFYAFNKCSGLKTIFIPDSVTGIESRTFNDCSGLTSISLPSTLTYIGEYAFGNPDEYDHGDIYPGNILDATILFRGTEEQWNAVSKREVYYKTLIFSTFSVAAYFEIPKSVYYYTGNPVTPPVTVTYDGKQLIEGTDYELTYKNNIDMGMASVEINGIGEYSGKTQLEFRIRLGCPVKVTCKNLAEGMKVSWEEVPGARWYSVYRDSKFVLRTSRLYGLDKVVRLNTGRKYTYRVFAIDKNSVKSEVYRTCTYYRLLPVRIKKLSNPSAGKMKVEYEKCSGCYGYVIRYGLKSDMSDGRTISVQGANTLSRTIGGLKKGRTYYVQVRTYMLKDGVRYYSGYSSTQKLTIKK